MGRLGDRFLAEARRGGRRDEGARAPPRERDELRDLLGALRRVLVATYFPSACSGGKRVTKVTPVNTSNRIWARAPPGSEKPGTDGETWVGTDSGAPARVGPGVPWSQDPAERGGISEDFDPGGRKPGIGIVRRKTLASRHSIAHRIAFGRSGPTKQAIGRNPPLMPPLGLVLPHRPLLVRGSLRSP